MIRVNLLSSTSPASRGVAIAAASRSTLAGAAIVLCTLAGVGFLHWRIGQQTAAVNARIARNERDLAHLKDAARLVDRAVARKSELSEKLATIDRLRAAQRRPVSMLAAISRSLPDDLWLLELDERGSTIQLDGRASSLASVTGFAERLQSSGTFDRPVEILTARTESIDEMPVVRFALKLQAYGTAAAAEAAPAPKPPAVPGRKGS
jgi:type IV pilus assembly protein PilN